MGSGWELCDLDAHFSDEAPCGTRSTPGTVIQRSTPLPDQDVLFRFRRVEHPAMRSRLSGTATGAANSVEGSDDDHGFGLAERSEAGESSAVSDQEQDLPVVLDSLLLRC